MGETTAISWCDHTFNPWIGCMKVSPACDGCYAENLMATRYGRVRWGAPGQGAGTRERTSAGNWSKPKAWDRKAKEAGTRPFVFCSSLADVFDNQVPSEWRRDLFRLIAATPNLAWLLLTKRPQLIIDLTDDAGGLPSNAALGTTAEDQERWDHNIGHLLAAKYILAPVFAFASCEPLLGRIDPRRAKLPREMRRRLFLDADIPIFDPLLPFADRRLRLDWIITGGETDQGSHKARPTNPQWFRDLRDACAETGTVYHHKQNGEWVSVSEVEGPGRHYHFDDGRTVRRVGKACAGRLIDGVLHDARPEIAA